MIPENYYDEQGEDYLNVFASEGMKIINTYEKNYVLTYIDKLVKEKQDKKINVLEIGVGAGRFAVEVVKRDINYVGIDISSNMVATSKKKIGNQEKACIFKHDVNHGLPFKNDYFDFIYSIRVLKYLDDVEKILFDINRVLDKKGIFIFSFPNKISLNLLNRFHDVPYKRFTEKEIIKLLERTGFTNIKITGGPKLPDLAYDHSNKFVLSIVLKIEDIFKFTNTASRLFYVYAKK